MEQQTTEITVNTSKIMEHVQNLTRMYGLHIAGDKILSLVNNPTKKDEYTQALDGIKEVLET